MDFSKLRKMAQQEIDDNNSRNNNNNNGPKVFYPGSNGTVVLKILYNPKSQILQRKIIRHGKVPCFQIYGEDCPICSAIHQAEESRGKDCGAFGKYGYKTRGLAYAVILKNDMKDSDIQPGELVLFMYPVSIYNQINELTIKAEDHLEGLIAKNEGNVFELTRKQKSNGFPEYTISIYPYGTMKVKDTEEEFQQLMEGLPDLNHAIVPSDPDQESRDKARATAETILAEYVSGSVLNPSDPSSANVSDPVKEDNNKGSLANAMNNPTTATSTPAVDRSVPSESSSGNDGHPECFGNHCDGEEKCMICPYEIDCITG